MKRRVLALLCVAMLLAGAVIPALAMPLDKYRYVYTANGGSLNMRTAPKVADNICAQIPYGTKIELVRLVNDNQWALCKYGEIRGYVQTRYLLESVPSKRPSDAAENDPALAEELKSIYSGLKAADYYALVRTPTPGSFVNLRWGPSKKIAVQARINDGSALHVIAQNRSWAQVEDLATGAVGFVMRSFLNTNVTVSEGSIEQGGI